jgi:hypothetical protein
MAILAYKPRLKMGEWTPPETPKPKRSRFFVLALFGWLSAIVAGYHWAPIDWRQRWVQEAGAGSEVDRSEAVVASTAFDHQTGARKAVARDSTKGDEPPLVLERSASARSQVEPTNTEILPCEEFKKGASAQSEGRLPMHLGRSAVDAFIGPNDWAKPCRGKHRQTIQLCVAISNGTVRGLSAKLARPNLTLEACLREQAKKLVLPPEDTLRIVNTTFRL